MPLYRILSDNLQLQTFRSTELGTHYQEKNLEDWIESNPQALMDNEPLLIIGRQVNTDVGVIDLLALDSEGASIIIELKRVPNQREVIAQSLEYSAWIASLDFERLRRIAASYFEKQNNGLTLESAWYETFGSEILAKSLNNQQRIFVVVEGENERLVSVANYLSKSGVNFNLFAYNYYRTESNEEILHIEKLVGDEETQTTYSSGTKTHNLPTEEELVKSWAGDVQEAYSLFREQMISYGLSIRAKKSGISFYKQTPDDNVFFCFVNDSHGAIKIWLRSDSLQTRFNFDAVSNEIKETLSKNIGLKYTPTWYILTPPTQAKYIQEVGEIILHQIADKIH